MGERSFAHSTGAAPAGPADETVRVATTAVNAAAPSTSHPRERGEIGRRRKVVRMALL
jgi:hypothetical protein